MKHIICPQAFFLTSKSSVNKHLKCTSDFIKALVPCANILKSILNLVANLPDTPQMRTAQYVTISTTAACVYEPHNKFASVSYLNKVSDLHFFCLIIRMHFCTFKI